MRELFIYIDFPSCKSSGFLSDTFASELEKEFEGSEYKLKFTFSASSTNAFFPSGYSKLGLDNADGNELTDIGNQIDKVFKTLTLSNN